MQSLYCFGHFLNLLRGKYCTTDLMLVGSWLDRCALIPEYVFRGGDANIK